MASLEDEQPTQNVQSNFVQEIPEVPNIPLPSKCSKIFMLKLNAENKAYFQKLRKSSKVCRSKIGM